MSTRISILDSQGLVVAAADVTDTIWKLNAAGEFENTSAITANASIDGGKIDSFVMRSGDVIVGRCLMGIRTRGVVLKADDAMRFPPGELRCSMKVSKK